MNLAHPELYFAEFLSKLELRRGMKGADVPFLLVKIGAGMPPYQLPLGRNVLWTGTMNQDETTKSLSDKVLDRSIIIHFPRPTELKRRLKLAPLDEKNRGPLLHKVSWQKWLAQGSSFSDDDVKPFKQFMEGMNATLAVAGRGIGHRVWQSVEYYMANHPDVRAAQKANDKDALAKALHDAFEDQLVQKAMPKLRGIDTRGKSKTECLDKILAQINTGIGGNPFSLSEDFNLACELGYGQFIWQSANYLKDEPASGEVEVVTPDVE
jgi:5-methylcytosine-specific restriction endonuclease McrBC GTP-binding regulatory subunit McrB